MYFNNNNKYYPLDVFFLSLGITRIENPPHRKQCIINLNIQDLTNKLGQKMQYQCNRNIIYLYEKFDLIKLNISC